MKYLTWIAVICICFIFLKNGTKNDKKGNVIYFGGILGGLIIYTIGLLFLYVFSFSEYEAVKLASFQRYLSTYFVGIGYFMAILFICQTFLFKSGYSKKLYVVTISVVLLFLPLNNIFKVTLLNQNVVDRTILAIAIYYYSSFKYRASVEYWRTVL